MQLPLIQPFCFSYKGAEIPFTLIVCIEMYHMLEALPSLQLSYQFLQFCTSGHSVYTRAVFYSINLPQDIGSFVTSVYQTVTSELDVIVVRKEGATQSHCDFHVKGSIMLSALQCMVANNYCHNIIDSDAPALLPEDGDLTGMHSDPRSHKAYKDRNCALEIFSISCTLSLLLYSHKFISVYHCMLSTCFAPTIPSICDILGALV